jgi:hypothetical protein
MVFELEKLGRKVCGIARDRRDRRERSKFLKMLRVGSGRQNSKADIAQSRESHNHH